MKAYKLFVITLLTAGSMHTEAAELATSRVREVAGGEVYIAEGVTEAVRQSVLSAQVAGKITQLSVKTGDRVQKGQVLFKIDSEVAQQHASASQSQVAAANAQLVVARKELERQQYLFNKKYISPAALDQSVAQFKATEATVRGLLAEAGAARTQTGFFIITAPFTGVVADIAAEMGDMALPGKPLLTLYDPAEMRVVAALPQSKATQLQPQAKIRLELTSMPVKQRWQQAKAITILPMADARSQTVQVRLTLPATDMAITPGMFSRAYFPLAATTQSRLMIPARAIVRRTELTAVYIITPDKKVQLRQVRPGRTQGEDIEILAGLSAGESVALDPVAASRSR